MSHFAAHAIEKPLSKIKLIDVILPLAIADTYTYSVPDSTPCPVKGMRVLVPIGKQQYVGIVYGEHEGDYHGDAVVRPIDMVLDEVPLVHDEQLRLWRWVSDYYLCPIGDVMQAAMPAVLKKATVTKERKRKLTTTQTAAPKPPDSQQARAIKEIRAGFNAKKVVLLHGVTSSGKTEVYIHLILEALSQGKQVLYLVPEIALTTQLTERLRKVFGDTLAVYHSRMTDAQRRDIYLSLSQPMTEQTPRVVVAARSGIFLPFNQLGLIILDEEHDPSYKQQDPAPRYHARSVAIIRAQQLGANVLLGTATPSVETYANALNGKYQLVEMNERYAGLKLPKIALINLQQQYKRKEMYEHFSDPLVSEMQRTLAQGKQIIVFQNRRGYAPYIECPDCGYVPKCPNCDVSLTYHKRTQSLVCHYCGYAIDIIKQCPACGNAMRDRGMGTEKIEDELARLFPQARIKRMDLDTTRAKDSYQQIIDEFAAHEVDILVGTQMVTKGLHFDDVALVAVLNADGLINAPDFRSYERAYQMLEQVAGRAGRTISSANDSESNDNGAAVYIQTFHPDDTIFADLIGHQYTSMYHRQMHERKVFGYPPFKRLIILTLKHRDSSRLDTASRLLQERLVHIFGERISAVLTPAVARVQNMFVRQIRIKLALNDSPARAKELLTQQIQYVLSQTDCKGTVILADVDPM